MDVKCNFGQFLRSKYQTKCMYYPHFIRFRDIRAFTIEIRIFRPKDFLIHSHWQLAQNIFFEKTSVE